MLLAGWLELLIYKEEGEGLLRSSGIPPTPHLHLHLPPCLIYYEMEEVLLEVICYSGGPFGEPAVAGADCGRPSTASSPRISSDIRSTTTTRQLLLLPIIFFAFSVVGGVVCVPNNSGILPLCVSESEGIECQMSSG